MNFLLKAILIAALGFFGNLKAQEKQTVNIGLINLKPFAKKDHNGNLTGLCPQIMNTVFEEKFFKVQSTVMPWKRSQMMLKDGKIDSIVCIGDTKQRREEFVLSDPIGEISYYLVGTPGVLKSLKKKEDILKYRGVFISGSKIDDPFLKKLIQNKKNNIYVTDLKQVFAMLLQGRADYSISPEFAARVYIKNPKLRKKLSLSTEPVAKNKVYIALSKKNESKLLLPFVNKKIAEKKVFQISEEFFKNFSAIQIKE